MSYTVTMRGDILHIAFADDVSVDDFEGLAREVGALEAGLDRAPDRIVDFTRARTVSVRYPTISRFAQAASERVVRNRYSIAFVAASDVAFGVARMYQTLAEHADITVQMVSSEQDAFAFLAAGSSREREGDGK